MSTDGIVEVMNDLSTSKVAISDTILETVAMNVLSGEATAVPELFLIEASGANEKSWPTEIGEPNEPMGNSKEVVSVSAEWVRFSFPLKAAGGVCPGVHGLRRVKSAVTTMLPRSPVPFVATTNQKGISSAETSFKGY